MFLVVIASAQSALNSLRVMSNIGIMTSAAALEIIPINFAFISACAGVTLTGAAVFTRKAMTSVDGSLSADAPHPTADGCGNSAYFSLPLPSVQSNLKKRSRRAERERKEAYLAEQDKKIAAQRAELALSYSNFSIVEMTFEKEPVDFLDISSKTPTSSCAMSMQSKILPDKSGASVAFSNVSAAETPQGGTPTSRSVALILAIKDKNGKIDTKFDHNTWAPPQQNPILNHVIAAAGSTKISTKTSNGSLASSLGSQNASCTDNKSPSKYRMNDNTIVNMVGGGSTTSVFLGSQLVEMKLSESAEKSLKSERYWSFLTKPMWIPAHGVSSNERPACPV